MANDPQASSSAQSQSRVFSIAKFRELFEHSHARQYMSLMDVEQIYEAIDAKNVMLLGKLYDILLQEQVADEAIVREFVMCKNRIEDNFSVAVTDAEKKLLGNPQKQKVAKAEQGEQKRAENILKKL